MKRDERRKIYLARKAKLDKIKSIHKKDTVKPVLPEKLMTQEVKNRQKMEELKKNHDKLVKSLNKRNKSEEIDDKLYNQARRFIKYDTST